MDVGTRAPEEDLLRDALGLAAEVEISLVSREPLGDGSVAAFEVRTADEQALTYVVDTSGRRVVRETGLVSGSPEAPEDRVWLHPADPHLPALAPVAFADAAQTLLARLGFREPGMPAIVAYRAGRRAVLRVPTGDGPVWIKVVPPSRLARIVETHRTLSAHGIGVPAIRGWSGDGLIVIDDALGVPAADAEWQPDALLDEVHALRVAWASVPLQHSARTGLERRLAWYSERLGRILHADDRAVVERIVSDARASWGDEDVVPIHGDLHFGQLFLGDRLEISSVIDVDTAGLGTPADDTAAFIAHAVASATLTPAPRDDRVWALVRAALARTDAAPDGAAARARAATHTLGHALGAFEIGAETRAGVLLRAAASVLAGDLDALDPTKSPLTDPFEAA